MAVLYINLSDASAVERNLNRVQNNLKNMLSDLNTARRKVEGINKNDYYINAYKDRIEKQQIQIRKDIDTINGFLRSYKNFINFAKDKDRTCASRITDSGYSYRKSTGLLKEEHKKIVLGVLVIAGAGVLTFFCPAAAPVAIGALLGGAVGGITGGADGFLAGALGGAVGGALFAVAGPAIGGLATSVFSEGAMATITTGVLTGALTGAGDGAVSGYITGGKEGAIKGVENGALFGGLFGGATELLGGVTSKIIPKLRNVGINEEFSTDTNINKYSLSGEEHYESLKDLFGADNVEWISKNTISNYDRLRISKWDWPPKDDLYLKYKDVYTNDMYYNQSDGSINWPKYNGFVEEFPGTETLEQGMLLNRYGEPTGNFFAPATDAYETRALAPHSETAEEYFYTPIKNFDVTSGNAAPWFGSPGGAKQFIKYHENGKMYTIDELIDKGFIEDVTDLVKKGF